MMDTALAVLALCLSVASLTWQFAAHALTGPRVKVSWHRSYPLADVGLPRECFTVTARNVGRFPATVRGVSVQVAKDGEHVPLALELLPVLSASLPHRLEPGDEAAWSVSRDLLRRMAADREVTKHWRAFVTLGTGKTVRSGPVKP
jgi:hypothetical protein